MSTANRRAREQLDQPSLALRSSDSTHRATGDLEEHPQHRCRSSAGQHALLLTGTAESLLTELQQTPLQSLVLLRALLAVWKREQTHHKPISLHPGHSLEINTPRCSQGHLEFPCSSL